MAGVRFDKDTIAAICEARFKRRSGVEAVVQSLNALCEKKYPQPGSFTVVMHKEEIRGMGGRDKKVKPGEYSIGSVIGG